MYYIVIQIDRLWQKRAGLPARLSRTPPWRAVEGRGLDPAAVRLAAVTGGPEAAITGDQAVPFRLVFCELKSILSQVDSSTTKNAV